MEISDTLTIGFRGRLTIRWTCFNLVYLFDNKSFIYNYAAQFYMISISVLYWSQVPKYPNTGNVSFEDLLQI